jgi:hypothetical protein
MTQALVLKLTNLATAIEHNVSADIAAYAPKLKAAAANVEARLEAWTSAVDEWVAREFHTETVAARHEAGAAYRSAVQEAHTLLTEAATKTN